VKRRLVLQGMSAGMSAISLGGLHAQDAWPTRAVRVITPVPPGSPADTFGRLISSELAKALGQPFVVDNKPGANGRIGTELTFGAKADGYTLLLSYGSAIVGARVLFPRDKSDTTKLQPIARFGSQGALLVVSPTVPARNVKEFVEWVKTRRETVNYATYGVGSGAHIVMEAVSRAAGIKLNHVPYKDPGQVLSDMQSDLVTVAALDAVTPIDYMRRHKVVAIGVNGRYRLPATPEVPTLAEQGYPIYMESWYGFFAPPGVPRAVVERLNKEVGVIVATPTMQERFKSMNLASTPNVSPEEFHKYITAEIGVWGRVIRESGIQVE